MSVLESIGPAKMPATEQLDTVTRVKCLKCGQVGAFPRGYANRRVSCNSCGTWQMVPADGSEFGLPCPKLLKSSEQIEADENSEVAVTQRKVLSVLEEIEAGIDRLTDEAEKTRLLAVRSVAKPVMGAWAVVCLTGILFFSLLSAFCLWEIWDLMVRVLRRY